MKNNVLELTKQLIQIPSYVDGNTDEQECLSFVESIVKKYLPQFTTKKQYIDIISSRYNLVLGKSINPKLLVVGHIDTVQPNIDWVTEPLQPTEKNGKLYGLGAADMKGSLASFLTALIRVQKKIAPKDLMLLIYTDEEYDFKGMRRFVQGLKIKPNMVLSLDGNLQISSGCRGLIEIKFVIKGKSAHAKNPMLGINAIRQANELVNKLENRIQKYVDAYLGMSTLNIAYLRGGTVFEENGSLIFQQEGNIIPDYVEMILEVRPAKKELSAPCVIKEIQCIASQLTLQIIDTKIRHDIKPLSVSYDSKELVILEQIYKKTKVSFEKANRKFSGYLDMQMLAENIDAPMFIIGAGGENAHGPNENVSLENIQKAQQIYEALLTTYCRKGTR